MKTRNGHHATPSIVAYEATVSSPRIFLSGTGTVAVGSAHNSVLAAAQSWLDKIDSEIQMVSMLASRYAVPRVPDTATTFVDAPATLSYDNIDEWNEVQVRIVTDDAEGLFQYSESDPQTWRL